MIDALRTKTRPRAESSSSPLVSEGLSLLYQAYQYAQDVARDPWEFAVEIDELRAAGMTNAEFRWLICKGYLEHARELPAENSERRQLACSNNLRFYKRSCFRLTPRGFALVDHLLEGITPAALLGIEDSTKETAGEKNVRPQWDGERHQFFVNQWLVKEFKVPSPNQETVLAAFQEEGWPTRIDDPLTPIPHIDPKRRLHDTIKSLNRNQKRNVIRFLGDGTGEGVRWQLTDALNESLAEGR